MKLLWKRVLLVAYCLCAAGCAVATPRITEQEINNRIASDREAMFKDQEALDTPIRLEDAMARAIKYNLEHRIKIMEDALSLRQLSLMTYDMLPRLVVNAGYTERDSYNASSSMNVSTGQESLAPSTSQDKGHFNSDLTLTWNILDFGVSYFQAKQQSDRAHIMKERRRKVVHSIMQQVRQAYWQAYGAQQLEGRLDALLKDVEKALVDTSSIEKEKLRPPMESLTYRKTLLEIMKQVETFRDELVQAKPQLASLMNLPLGQSYMIAPSELSMLKGPDALPYLEIRALLQRPELIEADYNERISLNETKKAIVRMLPGIELSVGGHYDSNSFLVSQQWVEGGARLTWNLMNLLSGQGQYSLAKSQVEIAQAQRLALGVAVLTQVHVAYHNFYSRKRQYDLSEQLQDVDFRIHEQTMNQKKSGAQNRLSEIRSATAALMAEYRSYQNYASLQSACGKIIATLGDEPLPETVPSYEIKTLSAAIGSKLYAPGALCSPIASVKAKAEPAAVSEPSPVQQIAPLPVSQVVSAPAPVINVMMTPGTITAGQSAKLAWGTKNAQKCDIQPGVGAVPPQGEVAVAPAASVTYSITCEGEGGSAHNSAVLAVVAAPVKAGLPEAAVAVAPPRGAFVLKLQFDTAEHEIEPRHHEELNRLAAYFKDCPEAYAEISGHTDDVRYPDNRMGNVQLSQRRADSIRNYLVTVMGIDPKRVKAVGYGARKPVASNRTEEGRQKNRRIEALFTCDGK